MGGRGPQQRKRQELSEESPWPLLGTVVHWLTRQDLAMTVLGAASLTRNETTLVIPASGQASQPPASWTRQPHPNTHQIRPAQVGPTQRLLTFGGKEGFFVKGSEVNGSFFVCFLKKSSVVELWNGSLSLKGSPPNGSRKREHKWWAKILESCNKERTPGKEGSGEAQTVSDQLPRARMGTLATSENLSGWWTVFQLSTVSHICQKLYWAFAAKPNSLMHMEEAENWLLQVVPWPPHMAQTHTTVRSFWRQDLAM